MIIDGPRDEVLYLVHRIPWPPDRGDKIRSFHQLRYLADRARVHVACFADDERDMGFANAMRGVTASQCVVMRDMPRSAAALKGLVRREPLSVTLFRHPTIAAYVADVLATRPIGAIVVFSGQMAQYVPEIPAEMRFIMDFVDVDSAKFAAYGAAQRGLMGWVNRREARLLAAYEEHIARIANVSLFVSDAEARFFRDATGLHDDRIRALGNGVDTSHFDPEADFVPLASELRGNGPLIVFTGQMDYRPNVEAVTAFADHVLPLVRHRHANAAFAIVGRAPTAAVQALGSRPGVIVTGAVDDVRPWLAAADVVVAPLRTARGVQNKVLEAMAMARAVVVSPQAAEGIDADNGTHLIVADEAQDQATVIAGLIDDDDHRAALGRAARTRCVGRYGWDAALAPLDGLLGLPAKRQ